MHWKRLILTVFCIAGLFFTAGSCSAGPSPAGNSKSLVIDPEVIDINVFFSGSNMTVTGTIFPSEDIVLEIAGKDSRNTFDLKGRIGPFWMTKGSVHLDNVPELYLVLLPEGKEWKRKIEDMGLGLTRLKERVSISGSDDMPDDVFTMFTELKAREDLYKVVPDAIHYTTNSDGTRFFSAVYKLPALLTSGTYDVTATRIPKDGSDGIPVKGRFLVRETGFVKLIDDLASNDRILYGVAAVVIAIIAGLAMGFIFRQSEGVH